MAIANILSYKRSLYDLPEPKYRYSRLREALKKGVAENAMMALSTKMPSSPNIFIIL